MPRKLLFLLVLFVVELCFALYNPAYNNADEASHMQAVDYWAKHGKAPDPYIDPDQKVQQDKHPPYTYVLGAVILNLTASSFSDEDAELRLPGPTELSWQLGHVLPKSQTQVKDGQLLLLRYVMLLHWCLLGWFLLALADLLWPDRPRFAWTLALVCSLLPQGAMTGASLTPDVPLSAFSTACFYFLVLGALARGNARSLGLKAGAFLALALLSKSSAVFLLPLLLIACWQRFRIEHGGRSALQFLLFTLLVPLIFSSWWYFYNWFSYGDPFQMLAQVETYTHSVRRSPLTSVFYEVFFEDCFRTFFGYWDKSMQLPLPFFYLMAALLGVAICGLLLLFSKRVRETECNGPQLRALALALPGFGILLLLTLIGNLTVHSPQGRYLYPALAPFMLLVGIGFRVASRIMSDGRAWYAVCVLWLFFLAWSFHYSVLQREGVNRAHKAGEGGVLYYEDCGITKLCPHRTQGIDLPDGAQLGRNVPWRSIDVDTTAVIYEFSIPKDKRKNLQVRVTYFNPDPRTPYVARELGHFSYPSQRLLAENRVLHEAIELTSSPKQFVFPLPDEVLEDGRLELSFERIDGDAAAVAELWIEEAWLSLEQEGDKTWVVNRTTRDLPWLLLHGKEGAESSIEGRIAAHGREAVLGLPRSSVRQQLLLRELSPWMLREAEAHLRDGQRYYGDMAASGGYRVRGTGSLAGLPFAGSKSPLLFLARSKEAGSAWQLQVLRALALDGAGQLDYHSPKDRVSSLDYVLQVGTWR